MPSPTIHPESAAMLSVPEIWTFKKQSAAASQPALDVQRVSAADKGRWVYPLDPRPDSVVLYSECTSGKRRAWYLPDDRHTASLVGLRGGWRHSRMKNISLHGS
ncbi:hypothetical protein TNCV_2986821 [Trichonephila clavipes]|nr:hypothetical protein TNCV_2986821 [Trichonephila clavipes]